MVSRDEVGCLEHNGLGDHGEADEQRDPLPQVRPRVQRDYCGSEVQRRRTDEQSPGSPEVSHLFEPRAAFEAGALSSRLPSARCSVLRDSRSFCGSSTVLSPSPDDTVRLRVASTTSQSPEQPEPSRRVIGRTYTGYGSVEGTVVLLIALGGDAHPQGPVQA